MVSLSSQCGYSHCVWRKDGLTNISEWILQLCVEEGEGAYNHTSVLDSHCVWRTDGLTIISEWILSLCVDEGWSYNHLNAETSIVCG